MMAHFLDTLVGKKFAEDLPIADLIAELGHAECIIADNVFEYYFERSGHARMGSDGTIESARFDLSAFPCVVPPFASTFVSTERYSIPGAPFRRAGMLLIRRPILDEQHSTFLDFLKNEFVEWQSRLHLQRQGVRWIVYAIPFIDGYEGNLIEPLISALFPIMDSGEWFRYTDHSEVHIAVTTNLKPLARQPIRKEQLDLWSKVYHDLMWRLLPPALLTLSFIHCRNVEIIEHDPTPTRQLRRQSQRRQEQTGFPLIRFRTIQIEPIKRVLHEEGRIHEVGLAQALHICRGHFKDFREGPGLFGKHHDVYWWNDHRRGTLEQGAILKDYKAPPPQNVTDPI
jgi:hypothetical protein